VNISRRVLFFLTIILLLFPVLASPQQKKPIIDYVFLLDTSGSMVGLPKGSGNVVIFPKVKSAINDYLDTIKPPANIFIYPYDEGLHDSKNFKINNKLDITKAQDYITNLKAEGNNTWIYRSLANTIDRMEEFRNSHPNEKHIVRMFLYTDGKDTDYNGPYNIESVMEHYQLKRGEHDWWLFYSTLGVELPKQEKAILESNEHVTYQKVQKQVVLPILVIENKIPSLHYGNLWQQGNGNRTALFSLPHKDKIPQNLIITAILEFSTLSSKGLGVTVTPLEFKPKTDVDFGIALINFQHNLEKCKGIHEFQITLKTNNSFIHIVPDSIDVKFFYDPPKSINISRSNGKDFPVNFGELDIHKKSDVIATEKIALQFNNQALETGGSLKISYVPSPQNPYFLNKNNLIINDSKKESVNISTSVKEITFRIVANNKLPHGEYEGKLYFESTDIIITGKGLEDKKDVPNVKSVNWSFEIPSKPIPSWIWWLTLLCVAGVIFVVIWIKIRPPVFSDLKLDVREPVQEEIDLSGKTKIQFGKNGEYFQNTDTSFIISAIKEEGRIFALLEVTDSGRVYLRKTGEPKEETVFGEERIFDSDTITFEDHKIIVSSFSLIRE